MKHDHLIFATYERFLLTQYNVETLGLYYSLPYYLIHCPEVNENTPSISGGTVYKWLDNHKMMSQWIRIADKLPQDAIKVEIPIEEGMPVARGSLITQPDVNYEVDLLIPKIFPDYEFTAHTPVVRVNFLEPVSNEGKKELERIFKENNFPYPILFTDIPTIKPIEAITDKQFKTTTTFRRSKELLSGRQLSEAVEKDEDEWLIRRNDILHIGITQDLRPASYQSIKSRGMVNASLALPENMRNYLCLFEEVTLVPPQKDRMEECLKALGITKTELLDLVELGKVHLLITNSVESYDTALLEDAIERKASHVHLTRSINTFTIQEMKRRNPLFFPAFPTHDKQILLRAVDKSLDFLQPVEYALARGVIAEIGHNWRTIPGVANDMNINFLSQFGIVNILNAIIKYHRKQDLKIELMAAAPMVELAAATNSVLMPCTEPGFNLSPFCQIIANFYSGIPGNSVVIPKPDYTNFAVEQILTISEHVPIVELAKTFHGAEVNRFRKLVLDMSSSSSSPEELEDTLEAFNYFVRQYEKDASKFSSWNIRGFLLNQLGKATGLPYGNWILKQLSNIVLKHGNRSEALGQILDSLTGALVGAYPNAILVSGMRDKIKKKI